MSIYVISGLIGVFFYLSSYALLQFGVLRGSGYIYTLMNMAAATGVLISVIEEYNSSSMLISIFWIAISVIGLTLRFIRNQKLIFTERERQLASQIIPSLGSTDLRRFLDTGEWVTLPDGAILTRQNEPVDYLYFLHRGGANVVINNATVAQVSDANFVGEITCLTGAPATATVILAGQADCFRIEAPVLRRFMRTNAAIQDQLERSFAADLRRKLSASASLVAELRTGRTSTAAE